VAKVHASSNDLYAKLESMTGEATGWHAAGVLAGREEDGTFRRNNVFDAVGAECRAVRERVGVMELRSFATFEVSGPGAEAVVAARAGRDDPPRVPGGRAGR
jgi:dimethylglycine dehydrogenase